MAISGVLVAVTLMSVLLSTGDALQRSSDDTFVVSLKSGQRICDVEFMQNDEPSTGLEDNSTTAEIYSLKIHSDIRYRYCRTQVNSRVANRNNNSKEVVFQMVLPETAFISKFSMEIDGNVYEAYVKEKEEAKQIYTDARNSGQSAGLIEVNARHANVFNVNVNVQAKSKVAFNLIYEELLIRKLNRYEHVININPEKFARIPDFGVTVNLHESRNLTVLNVPALRNDTENSELDTEETNADVNITRPTGSSATITWTPTVESRNLDNWSSAAHDVRKFVVQYDIAREADAGEILLMNGYFVHFFAPRDILPLRKHVVFVLDTSGSMQGNRLAQLQQAMTFVLDDLKPDDYFNIVEFASILNVWKASPRVARTGIGRRAHQRHQLESIFGEVSTTTPPPITSPRAPMLATASNLRKAHRFIKSLVADGGTNIHGALLEALQILSEAKPIISNETNGRGEKLGQIVEPMIMFLTDGEPTSGVTNKETILTTIKGLNTDNPVPIYSIGFGPGADFLFLKTLSLQNRAFARKIYEAGDADIQMRGFYKEISSPALSNVRFQYTSDKFNVSKLTNKKFQNLQLGSEIAVAGFLRPNKAKGSIIMVKPTESTTEEPIENDAKSVISVDVNANGRNGSILYQKQDINEIPESSEDYFLERLWAYLTIKQLLEKEAGVNDTETDVYYYDYEDAINSTRPASLTQDYEDSEEYDDPIVKTVPTPTESPKQRALRIAMKYGFVTPITSLVVMKPNETASSVDLEPLVVASRKSKPPPAKTTTTQFHRSLNFLSPVQPSTAPPRIYLAGAPGPGPIRPYGFPGWPGPTPRPRPASALNNYRMASNINGISDFERERTTDGIARYSSSSSLGAVSRSEGSRRSFDLKQIGWLLDHKGDLRKFITVARTRYIIASGSEVDSSDSSHPCYVQRIIGSCKLLKNCVDASFVHDRSVYMNAYFCPIMLSGKKYAGTCCTTSTG